MALVTGAATNAILQIATTWGTAVAGGADDKIVGEFSHNQNSSELQARQIGSGNHMITSATKGNSAPTAQIVMDMGYRNQADKLIAVLLGTSGAPAEVTGGQADYKHTVTFNTTLNAKYLSFAYDSASATVHEFPTCAVRSITIRTTTVPGYMELQAELLANKLDLSTSTNTNAVLAAATLLSSELAAVAFDDDFWIDTQASGALASGDQVNILSYELTLTRPQELPLEIKGSAGNGAPIATGLFEGSLKVTMASQADHTWWTAWLNETVYKSKLLIEGSQIGSGTNKSYSIFLPGMVLVKEPVYAVTSAGTNGVTLEFKLVKAAANPTGMSSTYPYFEIVNDLAASLLA